MRLAAPDFASLALSGANGVLPSQTLRWAVGAGIVDAGEFKIREESIQPASLDLRLGEVAYRVRCSFLPNGGTVEDKLGGLIMDELDLRREGAVLETNRPYIIPLMENVKLPPQLRGRTNPKSSTGRVDVFTRVITDYSHRFDELAPGYAGRMYLEVVPLSYTVRVRQGLALNQLRLILNDALVSDAELKSIHESEPIVYCDDKPVPTSEVNLAAGLFMSLDLRGNMSGTVGYRAKEYSPVIDLNVERGYMASAFWSPVPWELGDQVTLAPSRFYLLLSRERVVIPPTMAAEMTAYDPTSGELRTHYAGFFDPGFGFDPTGANPGSRAALEIRAHDVPFAIDHGQPVCKLTFERMLEVPEKLYGRAIGSSYQGQLETLSKHFVSETISPALPPE